MQLADIREEIKLKLFGYVLESEITDETIDAIIFSCIRELNRYYDNVILMTIPFTRCIDLTEYNVSSVKGVYRAEGFVSTNEKQGGVVDPTLMAQYQLLGNVGNMARYNDAMYAYASWNTMMQIRNTLSTDLAFRYDKQSNKLYINISGGEPTTITISYIPKLVNPEDITSDYWIDVLVRLCVATTKITLGRIRTRFTQSNALWTQDGELMINEGTQELNDLRTTLQENNDVNYIID